MALRIKKKIATPAHLENAHPENDGSRPVLAIVFYLLAIFLFALMDAIVKFLSAHYPISQILLFRSTIGFLPLLPWLLFSGLQILQIGKIRFLVARGILLGFTAWGFFYAFQNMKLADAYALAFTIPLFVTLLSFLLLGEKIGWRRLSALFAGFFTVIIMVLSQRSEQMGSGQAEYSSIAGAAAALCGAFFFALSMVFIRYLRNSYHPLPMIFYANLGVVLFAIIWVAIDYPALRWPESQDWVWFVLTGLLGGTAVMFLTLACRLASLVVLAPLDYTGMIWAVALGYLIWQDVPGVLMSIGAGILAAASLFIFYREIQLRKRAIPPKNR